MPRASALPDGLSAIRYRPRDLVAMLGTPLGRRQLLHGIARHAHPILFPLARGYRTAWLRHTRLCAVVGSLGKTTTQRAVKAVLGLPTDGFRFVNAGSQVASLLLAVRRSQPVAVLEVGIDGPGQMARYARLVQPDLVIVTAVASDHHRSLHTLETTRQEKSDMVAALPPDGWAILNGDDPNVLWMASRTSARILTCGFSPACDVCALEQSVAWPDGLRLRAQVGGQTVTVLTQLLGRHMAFPILAGLAVAHALELDLDQAAGRLAALAPTPGRMQRVRLSNGAMLLRDDVKSGEETIDAALDALAELPGRRLVVLGDVTEPRGNQGVIYRRLGGRVAAIADRAWFYGFGPDRYAAGARQAGMPAERFTQVRHEPPAQLAERIRPELQPGDVLLIKGRLNQRLARLALALEGIPVRCDIPACDARACTCETCPMLTRGWAGHRVVI